MRSSLFTILAASAISLATTTPTSCFWCISTGQFWEENGKLCKNAKTDTTLSKPTECTANRDFGPGFTKYYAQFDGS